MRLKTPVLMIAFNRPDLTERVFEAVQRAQPARLFFFVDAPRNKTDEGKVSEVKKIIELVDWDCDVKTFFPKKNLGHTKGPIAAIDWVFKNSEQAIVLEDDCLPNQSFFRYCEDMLEHYKNNEQVWSIGGAVYLDPMPKLENSCWFSPLTSTWGWASWRRTWRKVDFRLKNWPELRNTDWLTKKIGNKFIAADYKKGIDKAYNTMDTKDFVGWDYIYNFSMLLNDALDARPAVNLVSNIGFRADASHTKEKTAFSDFPTKELSFPLKFPLKIKPNLKMEILFYQQTNPNFNNNKERLKMLPVPRFMKRIIRRLISFTKKLNRVLRLESDYKFNVSDYCTYLFQEMFRKKMKIKELSEKDGLSRLQVKDFKFFWPQNQGRKELSALWQEIFNASPLNPHAYEARGVRLDAGDIVVDAGCAEGFFTHKALQKRVKKVIAFEPLGVLTNCLEKTFADEIAAGTVKLEQSLLGSQTGMAKIKTNQEMLSASAESSDPDASSVPMTTLDDWFARSGLPRVDFIKMDVENGEMEAIKGATRLIKEHKPKLAIAVYHDYQNAEQIKKFLLSIRPDYKISFRGIYDYDNVLPRPYMLLAR